MRATVLDKQELLYQTPEEKATLTVLPSRVLAGDNVRQVNKQINVEQKMGSFA